MAERVYAVLFRCLYVLSNPSRVWHTEYMEYVVGCCVMLHNMILETRGDEEKTGIANNITSIDQHRVMIRICSRSIPCTPFEDDDYLHETAYRGEDSRDQAILQNALAYAAFKRSRRRRPQFWVHSDAVHGTAAKESESDSEE